MRGSPFHLPLSTPIANEVVKLIPFDLDLHTAPFIAQSHDRPELWSNMPVGPFKTITSFRNFVTGTADSGGLAEESPAPIISFADPAHFLLAVIDTTRPASPEDEEGELAGIIGYVGASKEMRSVEVGALVILPAYQRSHVATNAVGLMLGHAFEEMGVVRAEWTCSAANGASVRLAGRMGFVEVGTVEYHYRYKLGRRSGKVGNGKAMPPGCDPDDLWRDSKLFSMTWEQWGLARERVEEAMKRR